VRVSRVNKGGVPTNTMVSSLLDEGKTGGEGWKISEKKARRDKDKNGDVERFILGKKGEGTELFLMGHELKRGFEMSDKQQRKQKKKVRVKGKKDASKFHLDRIVERQEKHKGTEKKEQIIVQKSTVFRGSEFRGVKLLEKGGREPSNRGGGNGLGRRLQRGG